MNEKQDSYLDTSLNESTLEMAWVNEEQQCVMTPEWDLVDQIKRLLKTAKKIVDSVEESPFFLAQDTYRRVERLRMTKLGTDIQLALKADIDTIRRHFHTHEFHPLPGLLVSAADERMLFDAAWTMKSAVGAQAVEVADAFNGFVKRMRDVALTPEFRNRVRIFERRSKENFLQFNRYVTAHYAKRSRLLWVRLDLWYRDAYLSVVDRDVETVYRKIKQDWRKLHRDLSRKIFKKDLRGFVWKLEYGLNRSFHLHTVLILDSSKLKSDVTIAKIVGDHWENVITEGRGGYFNCNAVKTKYRFGGIGQIHRDNEDLRRNLRDRIGGYITKPDLVLALQTPDAGRSFGKGKTPQ